MHGRQTKKDFKRLVDRVKAKLASWKTNCLFMDGRVTLASFVISSIPFYFMQTTRVPVSVCLEIEKLQHDFVWGHVNGGRKFLAMRWDVVCRNKKCGGLGLKKLQAMNDAFIMKLGWKVKTELDNLCSKVLVGKYGRGMDLRREVFVKNSDSIIWKEIGGLWGALLEGQRWIFGKGDNVFFCLDDWGCEDGALIDGLNLSLPINNMRTKIKDMVNLDGQWMIDNLRDIIGANRCFDIMTKIPPNINRGSDYIIWKHQSNGQLSVKTAYDQRVHHFNNNMFTSIWKLKVPERVKIFVWQLGHDRLLTNERGSRWWGGSGTCPVCCSTLETSVHALHDCPFASSVWNGLVDPGQLGEFYSLDFNEWIKSNLSKSFSSVQNAT